MYSWAWMGVLRVLFVWVVFLLLHIHYLLETAVISSFSLASSVPSPSLSKGAFHFLNDRSRHTASVQINRKRIYLEARAKTERNDRTPVLDYDKTPAIPRLSKNR